MNPYDFVHIDWDRLPQRQPPVAHDRFSGLNGRMQCELTVLTPLFLPAKDATGNALLKPGSQRKLFCQSAAYRSQDESNPQGYFIPGSSLKGLFRSLVETVAQGCFRFFNGTYKSKIDGTPNIADLQNALPSEFAACQPSRDISVPERQSPVCPACRLFGLIGTVRAKGHDRTIVHAGNVTVSDAVCTRARPADHIFTAVMDGPKPRHRVWYLNQGRLAGRKFYFHFRNLRTLADLRKTKGGDQLNSHIQPIGEGSKFQFTVDFTNVDERDFAALLYAVALEEPMRHKFGYAKPCGLGSVRIEISSLGLVNSDDRYRRGQRANELVGNELLEAVASRIEPFIHTIPAQTLADLRRIWHWPPHDVHYDYPTQKQFSAHPNDPIRSTDQWAKSEEAR